MSLPAASRSVAPLSEMAPIAIPLAESLSVIVYWNTSLVAELNPGLYVATRLSLPKVSARVGVPAPATVVASLVEATNVNTLPVT